MRKHPVRCSKASPKSKCKCCCGGAKHGSALLTIGKEDLYERTVTERLGGQLAEVIKSTPSTIICPCGKAILANFLAYPHDGGLPDSIGKKWWLFVECPYCGEQTNWHKFNRIRSLF